MLPKVNISKLRRIVKDEIDIGTSILLNQLTVPLFPEFKYQNTNPYCPKVGIHEATNHKDMSRGQISCVVAGTRFCQEHC